MIIFECDDFVICNKPIGVSMHYEKNQSDVLNLIDIVKEKVGEQALWPVHRLDKDTSGLIILAKSKLAASEFGRLFESRKVEKTYIALCSSKPSKKEGKITGDMKKTRDGSWMLARSKSNPAITQFYSTSYAYLDHSLRLFYLLPKTGKTHQLRVALKSLGAAILGDKRYKGDKADRLYLHAYKLKFNYKNQMHAFSCLPEVGLLFSEKSLNISIETLKDKYENCI